MSLLHEIEGLVGRKMSAHELPEADVLKGITRVFSAKRAAALRATEIASSTRDPARAKRSKAHAGGGGGGREAAGGGGE